MKQNIDESLAFSLVRDDLPFRLQRRVGLIPERGLGTVRRAVFFALLTWLPIVVWAGFERIWPGTVDDPCCGTSACMFVFYSPVPLLILGEAKMHKLMTRLIPYFLTSGLVQDEQEGAFKEIIQGVIRLRNLTMPWVMIAIIIIAWTVFKPAVSDDHELSWAAGGFGGWWLNYVSRPIFSVLMVAWLWRLVLWLFC